MSQIVFQDGTSGKKYACYSAGDLISECRRIGIDTSWWEGKPNSITIPRGMGPSYGYILLTKAVLDYVDTNAHNHSLIFVDSTNIQTVEVKYLCIVDGRCIAPSKSASVSSNIFLIRLSDSRHLSAATTVSNNYNIPSHDLGNSGETQYYDSTINGASPYTFEEILESIWGNLPITLMGTFPALDASAKIPTTPIENLFYSGKPAWECINDLLSLTGNTIRCTPEGTYKIVGYEVTEEDDALIIAHEPRLIDTMHGVTCIGTTRYPEYVKINFPLRDYQFHDQPVSDIKYTTPQDLFYNHDGYVKSISLATINPALVAIPGTDIQLSTPLLSARYWLDPYTSVKAFVNQTDIDSFAEFLADRYINRITNYFVIENIYTGFNYFYPGSRLDHIYYGDTGGGPITFISSVPDKDNPFRLSGESQSIHGISPIDPVESPPIGTSRHHSEDFNIPYFKAAWIKVDNFTGTPPVASDVAPGDEGEAYILRGSIDTGGWSWVDLTSQIRIDFVNSSSETLHNSDEKHLAFWDYQIGRWCVIGTGAGSKCYLGRATTAITAADWEANPPVLGSGTVQPYDLGTPPALICPSGGEPPTETWYNMAPQAVNQYAGVVAIDWQGIKLIIVETCQLIETTGCA